MLAAAAAGLMVMVRALAVRAVVALVAHRRLQELQTRVAVAAVRRQQPQGWARLAGLALPSSVTLTLTPTQHQRPGHQHSPTRVGIRFTSLPAVGV
jgi:hypothetical protein